MKGIDAKFLDELKDKNDIVDVISHYVVLEQKGGSFWGRCPFHHEKTASFAVHASGQFYYCFGCHKSGDVITFIREIENLDFMDAVRFLADRAKMQMPNVEYDEESVKEQKEKKQRLLNILRDSALFYVANLKTDGALKHREYILKRKITAETVTKFGMGASLDFNGLPDYLKSKGYSYREMVEAGVCGEKNGRFFDWLGGRLIIPVIDQFNNVIAFDGRRIDDVKEQKYINTKETQVFIKGKTLFNINNLKKVKNETGISSVIIVEGHLDVVSVYQAGIRNVVASMGTALTKDQARIIKRYCDKVYISYDGDGAGQKATMRGLEILKDEGIEVMIVSMPEGMDPDDVIKQSGKEGYEKLLAQAKPLIDFKLLSLKNSFDLEKTEEKRKYVSGAIKIISESSSPAEQEELLKQLRDQTHITLESLKRELYNSPSEKKPEKAFVPEFNDNLGDKYDIAARYVLSSYLFHRPFAFEYEITGIEFAKRTHKNIQAYIVSHLEDKSAIKFNDLYEIEDDAEELSKIAGLETDENKPFNQALYFNDCVKTLKIMALDRESERLTQLFKVETDTEKRKQINAELQKILIEKISLKN